MKAFWSLVGCILILLSVVWYLTNYVFVSDEQRILRVIESARLNVESGSIISMSNLLSSDYQHSNGADRALVLRGLQQLFNETEQRKIRLGSTQIDVQGDRASAQIRFSFDARFNSSNTMFQKFIENDQMNEIRVEFIKEDRGWKIIRTITLS